MIGRALTYYGSSRICLVFFYLLKTHRRAVGKRRADGGDEEIAVTSYCVMVASFADVAHRTARVQVYILAIPGDY